MNLEEHPFRLHVSAFCSAPMHEQFSFIKRKTSFPVDHVDCSVDFDWLHQSLSGYSGAGDYKVSLSLFPSLRVSDRSCCWMEEWPLSVWVSPRGQLGEIIRQDSYRQTGRQTDAVEPSCCSLTQTEAHLATFLDEQLLLSTSYELTVV